AAWVQYGPDGPFARAVTGDTQCPALTTDGGTRQMVVRALPSPLDFPPLTCEAQLRAAATRASAAGVPLPVPSASPRRIVVLGDAGCRIEAGMAVQPCGDSAAWPFARLAASAAAWRPDLVIHVGDYVYRAAPCPGAWARCAGSPWGDTWAAWEADFFAP